MVDANAARVPQDRVDHRPERFIALADELVGTPRRLRPVLTELVELVGRCARGDAEREHILHRPRVGAVRVNADGEIVHDAELHACPQGGRLRGRQLIVELPLQPPVEVDRLGVLGREPGDRGAGRAGEFLRPAMPVRSVTFRQRAPDREVVEAAAFACAVGLVCQLSACGPFDAVDGFEHVAFRVPRRVSVDQIRVPGFLLQLQPPAPDSAAPPHLGELGDRFGSQIQRIDVAPGCRQIRRRFHRCHRRGGVHRVDQNVSGAMICARPHSQIGEIGQITYAPRSFRLHAVELGGQSPYPLAPEPERQLELGRDDDQRCARLGRARLEVEPVIAQRQIGGQLEGGLSDQSVAEIVWGSVVLQLTQPCTDAAVLQPDPQAHRLTVGDVHPERGFAVGAGDDGRRQASGPVFAVMRRERRAPFVLGGRRHAERRQHGDQRGLGHVDVPARPVLVLGGDPVATGKLA